MFGNWIGWLISAVIALLVGALLLFLPALVLRPSPPTALGANAANLTLQMPISPRTLAPRMTREADAGPLYRQAIDAYGKSPRLYDDFRKRTDWKDSDIRKLTALEPLLQAADAKNATIFAGTPRDVIRYDRKEPLRALETVGKAANWAGLMYRTDNPDKAMQYYRAAFSLGVHLTEERLRWDQYDVGMKLFGDAAAAMKTIAEDRKDIAFLGQFNTFTDSKIRFYNQAVLPVYKAVKRLNPWPGDVFAIAENCKDRAWRIEAILLLGQFKYNVDASKRRGDQHHAMRLIDQYAKSSDPLIRAAAEAARDLTIEDFRVNIGRPEE